MKSERLPKNYVRFAGLRAKCACGAVWNLRGCVLSGDEPASARSSGFPLHELRCTCGGIAQGFVPRGAISSTIRATPAA